jgi:biopolymer transport protein ExbB
MMRTFIPVLLVATVVAIGSQAAKAQDEGKTFGKASSSLVQQAKQASAELDALRKKIADEKLPLMNELSKLETELLTVRSEEREVSRDADSDALALDAISREIKNRKAEIAGLSDLLQKFSREFETSLHIAERERYEAATEKVEVALESKDMKPEDVLRAQAKLLDVALGRAEEIVGGAEFGGSAVGPDGILRDGTFTLLGPVAYFRSRDGKVIGTATMKANASEPRVEAFTRPSDIEAAKGTGSSSMLIDTTLGNAHRVAETDETLLQHIKKGGPVMVPILGMAALALLIAVLKWIGSLFVRRPAKKQMAELFDAVKGGDASRARSVASRMRGPIGRMLSAGADHVEEPRDLIEEVMYEHVLTTRMKLNRMLPFIAICAASAPLLGLLGTVSGIINTFKMITLFGSGDVKSLSGGISEALITTKFGLIVAIPSLLLHAFLSRRAKGMMGKMEAAAVSFANVVSTSPFRRDERAVPNAPETPVAEESDRDDMREQVTDVLREMLGGGAKAKTAATPISRRGLDGELTAGEAHA